MGARTNSELDLALFRFFYTYSFYRSEKVELSLSPGIYLADFDAKIKGTLTIEPGDSPASSRSRTIKESEWAPLPTVGFAVDYKIFPRLTVEENLRVGLGVTGKAGIPDLVFELFPVLDEMRRRRGGDAPARWPT